MIYHAIFDITAPISGDLPNIPNTRKYVLLNHLDIFPDLQIKNQFIIFKLTIIKHIQ